MRKAYQKWRTPILALLTFVVFVWAAIGIFDVKAAVMWVFFLDAISLIGLTVVSAGVFVGVIVLIKKLINRP